jgi:hypothetical protein
MGKWNHIKFRRLREFDERSRNFPVRSLTVEGEIPRTWMWECNKVLDQGSTPECVGYAGAHYGIATPIPQPNINDIIAHQFYKGAQDNDEWPGDDYEGSSGIGLFKYLKKIKFCTGGYWAFTLMEELLGISRVCPALTGTSWMTGMMEPDSEGFVKATGYNEGGHEYLRLGVNMEEKYIWIHNSWGKGYGLNGRAKIRFDEAEKLRSGQDTLFLQGEKTDWQNPIPPQPDPGWCKSKFSRWL